MVTERESSSGLIEAKDTQIPDDLLEAFIIAHATQNKVMGPAEARSGAEAPFE